MKQYYFIGEENVLEKYGFGIPEYNSKCFIRYIPLTEAEKVIADKGGVECTYVIYRTLYYDRSSKEIISYNDYWDKQIEMNEQWIADLINDNLIREE